MNFDQQGVILVVDDVPDNLGVLFGYLEEYGFKILIAESGESVFERLKYVKPDVILLDIMMPGMDGFETCQRLKADEQSKDIPVIFMTARTDIVDKVKGFSLGAVDYITKPLEPAEVLARVKSHMTIKNLQRKLESELLKRDKLIGELNAYSHTVAHDLKGPLGSIIGFSDALSKHFETMPPEEIADYLGIIGRTGHKMRDIIDGLLLLASTRKTDVTLMPLNMSQIVSDVQDRLAYKIQECEASITAPATWPLALGYTPWVEGVWANYIDNALKYGGDSPTIILGAKTETNEQIRFWVSDSGPGLSKAVQEHLFSPLTQFSEKGGKGQGLGLSIVERIVTKLGGRVGVESEVGKGSTFYFTLPQAIV